MPPVNTRVEFAAKPLFLDKRQRPTLIPGQKTVGPSTGLSGFNIDDVPSFKGFSYLSKVGAKGPVEKGLIDEYHTYQRQKLHLVDTLPIY